MVGNDPPAFFEFAKQKREFAFRIVLFTFQVPAADDKGGVFGQDLDLKFGECQYAHFVTGAAVGFSVVIERLLPAVSDAVAGDEFELVGAPISDRHKCFEVGSIPGCGLIVHDFADRDRRLVCLARNSSDENHCDEKRE